MTQKPTVLVVDDEFVIALETEALLRDEGFDIAGPAVSLSEAQDIVARTQVDAAVIDLNLKGISALPLADALDRQGIPYLFITGYDRVMRNGRREKSERVVLKPVDPNELMFKLHGQLRKRLAHGHHADARSETRPGITASPGE